MPAPIPFAEFKRKMKHLGVVLKQGGKATHFKLVRKVGDQNLVYCIARSGNEVLGCYIVGTKRALQISDDEFDKA